MCFSLKSFHLVKILVYSFVKHTNKKTLMSLLRLSTYPLYLSGIFLRQGGVSAYLQLPSPQQGVCLSKLNTQKLSLMFNTHRIYLDFHLHLSPPPFQSYIYSSLQQYKDYN